MKHYPSYKDSDIEWIGEIPDHWNVIKLKRISVVYGGSTPSTSHDLYWNGNIHWVTTDDLGKLSSKEIKSTVRTITEKGLNSISKILSPKGSIIISNRAPIGHIGILSFDACTNQGCKSIVFNSISNPNYYYYYFSTKKDELDSLGRGTTFKELSTQALKDFEVILPPTQEQTQIAAFLDNKTKQIDDLITKKEKLIELLKEERTAIINQAVTKGLDPDVPMKDSGIEWLGEIPEHWEVKKLKYVASIYNSNVDKKVKDSELSVQLCNYTDVYNNEFIGYNEQYMFATASDDQIEKFTLREKDVLITKDSESQDDIAVPALVVENLAGIVCGYHLSLIRQGTLINGGYLFYLFLNTRFNEQFIVAANGITRFGLGLSSIKNVKVSLPPQNEQLEIFTYLKSETKRIDDTISVIQSENDLLEEYKTSLINEAVTGKIDVRDF